MDDCVAGCGSPQGEPYAPLDEKCWYALAGMCLGKKRFRRFRHAQLATQHIEPLQRAYTCSVCGHPHIGTAAAFSPRIRDEREAIIQRLRANGYGWVLTRLAGQFELMDRAEWKRSLR